MGTPLLTRNYLATSAVTKRRLVKIGAADGAIVPATGATAGILGVVADVGAAANERTDVHLSGVVDVELGGTVTRGDTLTSDSVGRAISATMGSGTAVYTVGVALESGVSGDIISMLLQPNAIDSQVIVTDVTVTSAEILALNATPKQLVAAPGAGKILLFEGAQIELIYNSAAYAGIAAGEDLSIKYTNGSGAEVAQCEATGFLDATANAIRYLRPAAAAAVNPAVNAALVLHMLVGEIITGNSPLKLRVQTRTITTPLP